MGTGQQGCPFVARQQLGARATLGTVAPTGPSVAKSAGVTGVVQHLQHLAVLEAAPGQLTAVRAPVQTAGELQPFFGEGGDGRARRAGAGEGGEQAPDGALHLGVGVEGDGGEAEVHLRRRLGDAGAERLPTGDRPAGCGAQLLMVTWGLCRTGSGDQLLRMVLYA